MELPDGVKLVDTQIQMDNGFSISKINVYEVTCNDGKVRELREFVYTDYSYQCIDSGKYMHTQFGFKDAVQQMKREVFDNE